MDLQENPYEHSTTFARIVGLLGFNEAKHLAEEAKVIFNGEGMLTLDGSRNRSLGGIFYALAKRKIPARLWRLLQPFEYIENLKQSDEQTKTNYLELLREANQLQHGEAAKVKIIIVGRPGKVQQADSFVSFVVESTKIPYLPKGLPNVQGPTKYLVMVAKKNWEKVEKAIEMNPKETLIIHGFSTLNAEFNGICVLANNVLTTEQQKANQEQNKPQAHAT